MLDDWLVYWLHNDSCVSYEEHGCVGATKETRLYQRLNQHQKSKRIPKHFRHTIIFRGSRKEALALEASLRPKPHIGWNVGVGGFADGTGLRGVPKTAEQREKMRQAALRRYADPKERERLSRDVKKGLRDVDRSGTNNHRFGKAVSEETKQKIRDAITERGGVDGANNPNYRHGRYVNDD